MGHTAQRFYLGLATAEMEPAASPWKFLLLLFFVLLLVFSIPCHAKDQATILRELMRSREAYSGEAWEVDGGAYRETSRTVYIGPQAGLAESSKISSLPGQPEGVDFDQYGGYITVDPKNGKALFYYFVESPHNASSKPLVLWLNGGPGCSSLGYGAMEELGPFRVNSDGKTLHRNEYAWNNVANVIFLESPAGVGFSYSNTSSDYVTGDRKTAEDSYIFLVNWLERYPQYKTRDFYITGESYAGHYVPQLANTILSHNKNTNQTVINLKGIAIGNAYIDRITSIKGSYDFYWTHAINSDETNAGVNKYCDFTTGNFSTVCEQYLDQGDDETGRIDGYNIYAPLCLPTRKNSASSGSVKGFDPCSSSYVHSYLNLPSVQAAFHAKATKWEACGGKLQAWNDRAVTVLPIIKNLMASGIRLWIYSGDVDAVVSVTTSRYAINTFNLPIETKWKPWYTDEEVAGYVVGYKGLTFVTVRGAGHEVPSYQPERALTMISSFLQGTLPPTS